MKTLLPVSLMKVAGHASREMSSEEETVPGRSRSSKSVLSPRRAFAVVSLGVALLVAGCGETNSPSPSPTDTQTAEQDQWDQGEAAREQLAEVYGVTDPPEVEMIRKVSLGESEQIMAECMGESGWVATIHEDGTREYGPFTPEQEQAFGLASYVCMMQYPLEEKYAKPLTQAQHELVYAHLQSEWIPCMAELGITLPELPTLESYLAEPYQDWHGNFSDQINAAVASGKLEDFNQYGEICPPRPTNDVLYGP